MKAGQREWMRKISFKGGEVDSLGGTWRHVREDERGRVMKTDMGR